MWLGKKSRVKNLIPKKPIQSILKEARETTQTHQEKLARERFFEDFKNRQRERVRDFTSAQENQSRHSNLSSSEQLCFPWLYQKEND